MKNVNEWAGKMRGLKRCVKGLVCAVVMGGIGLGMSGCSNFDHGIVLSNTWEKSHADGSKSMGFDVVAMSDRDAYNGMLEKVWRAEKLPNEAVRREAFLKIVRSKKVLDETTQKKLVDAVMRMNLSLDKATILVELIERDDFDEDTAEYMKQNLKKIDFDLDRNEVRNAIEHYENWHW